MKRAVRFELACQDGPARLGKLELCTCTYISPCLAKDLNQRLPYTPDEIISSHYSGLKEPFLAIRKMPSWQFLGIDPEANLSDIQQKIDGSLELSNDAPSFLQLPQDVAHQDTKESSPYAKLSSEIQDELIKELPLAFPYSLLSDSKDLLDLKINKPTLINLYDIVLFLKRPRLLIEKLKCLRSNLNVNCLLYAPSVPPNYFPLLSYLGVDVFDASFAINASFQSLFMSEEGVQSKNSKMRSCLCYACYDHEGEDPTNYVLDHNLLATEEQIRKCRWAINEGKLWDLVRRTAVDVPSIQAALRYLKGHYNFLESSLPIRKSHPLLVTTAEDLWRPEVKRYRHRIRERYYPPTNVSVCIILPCSAKKPYSLSKSHQRFNKVLSKYRSRANILELMLTSPLGVVPRTLERMYPAANYDIPVTGDWTHAEQKMVVRAFKTVLDKVPSSVPVLIHLNEPETEMLSEALKETGHPTCFSRVDSSPHSDNGLRQLRISLDQVFEDIQHPSRRINEKYQTLKDTVDYQFGREMGEKLVTETMRIKGKAHIRMQAFSGETLILTYHASTGMVTLTWKGAEQLIPDETYAIRFDDYEIEGSTIFCSAITCADEKIRQGDEVVVLNRDGVLVGIGKSLLSSKALVDLQRGPGVKLRHKRKPMEQ